QRGEPSHHPLLTQRVLHLLSQRFDAEDRQILLDRQQLLANRGGHRGGVSSRAHLQRHLADQRRRYLKEREVHDAHRTLAQAVLLRILHHADDFELAQVLIYAQADGPPQRVGSTKEVASERFVDDGNLWSSLVIARAEIAPQQDRDASSLEEVRTDRAETASRLLARPRRVARYGDEIVPPAALQQAAARRVGRENSRDSVQAFKQALVKRVEPRALIANQRGINRQHEHMLGTEPQVYAQQFLETAREQSGDDQQDQRQRHLRYHQGAAQPIAHGTRAPLPPAFLERRGKLDSRRSKGRRQAEQHACEERNRSSESKDPSIRGKVQRRTRTLGHELSQAFCPPECQEQACCASEHGQQQVLGEQLPDEPPSPCSDGKPQRDFLLSRRASRQQQVGDVGAGDQQHQPDQPHQYPPELPSFRLAPRRRSPSAGLKLDSQAPSALAPTFRRIVFRQVLLKR